MEQEEFDIKEYAKHVSMWYLAGLVCGLVLAEFLIWILLKWVW